MDTPSALAQDGVALAGECGALAGECGALTRGGGALAQPRVSEPEGRVLDHLRFDLRV